MGNLDFLMSTFSGLVSRLPPDVLTTTILSHMQDTSTESNPAALSVSGYPPANWFTPGRFTIVLMALVFAPYWKVLLGFRTFVFRDYGIFGYPLAFYHRECFWRGELPLWNPLSNCGLPFLAQWNTLTLYPLSLIYLLFPLPWSLSFFCLVHQVLAGITMYFLAHRWTQNRFAASVAGFAFAFNGLTLGSLMWPNNIAALAWMPCVALFAEEAWQKGGRSILLAGCIGTLQMLAGAPEIILFTWTTILVIWLTELTTLHSNRSVIATRFFGVVALVSLFSAAQLLPFLDLLAHSQRDRNFAEASWAMPIWGWANLLVPLFRCYESPLGVFFQEHQDWTSSYYLGIGVFVFAVLAAAFARQRRVWVLTALTLCGLLLALGEGGHIYPWAKKLIPLMGFIRFPIKFAVLAVFAVPLLATFTIASFENPSLQNENRIKKWALATGAVFAALILLIVLISKLHPVQGEEWTVVWKSGLSRFVLLSLILGMAVKLASIKQPRNQLLARPAILALVALDLLTHAPQQNPTVAPNVYEPGLLSQRLVPKPQAGGPRALMSRPSHDAVYHSMLNDTFKDYAGRRLVLFGNCNLLDSIPTPDGFYSLYIPAQREVWAKLFFARTNQFPSGLADFLSIAHATDPVETFNWDQRPSFLPLVTAGQKPVYAEPAETLQLLIDPAFDPRRTVYLPGAAKPFVAIANLSPPQLKLGQYSSQRINLEVDATEPAMVVLSQAFYHAWRAYVNDTPTPIFKANYGFQAFVVPSGHSAVRLVYKDRAFEVGAIISLMSVFVSMAWLLRTSGKTSITNA